MTPKLINALLLQAVSMDDKDKIELILKDKRCDISEYEALMMAIEYNHQHIVHLLLKNTSIDKVILQEILNIIVVVKPKWIEVIKQLIDIGIDLGKKNENGDTVIHIAFNNINSHGVIDLLLKRYLKKSSENLVNSKGISLLHIACTRTKLIFSKKLLEANSPFILNAPVPVSLYTPLHYAVKRKRHLMARFLIKHGADIYKQDKNGSTPLHWALWHHDTPMIDMIISMDLRKENIVNVFGLSHFMAACAGSDAKIIKNYLQALLDQPNYSIRDLITSKAPNYFGFTGYAPLHFAVKFGCVTAIKLLLRYGADCCSIVEDHLTPHLLAHVRGDECIKGLLQEHCDLVNKCRVMRAQDQDFRKWGEEYEEHVVMEGVMALKHLRGISDNLNSIQCNNKSFDKFEYCQSEFVSTDFQSDLNLFCT